MRSVFPLKNLVRKGLIKVDQDGDTTTSAYFNRIFMESHHDDPFSVYKMICQQLGNTMSIMMTL